jgi:hypothetical protein
VLAICGHGDLLREGLTQHPDDLNTSVLLDASKPGERGLLTMSWGIS